MLWRNHTKKIVLPHVMDQQSQIVWFFPEIVPVVTGSSLKSGAKYKNRFLGKKTVLLALQVQDCDMTYFFCLVPSQNERSQSYISSFVEIPEKKNFVFVFGGPTHIFTKKSSYLRILWKCDIFTKKCIICTFFFRKHINNT